MLVLTFWTDLSQRGSSKLGNCSILINTLAVLKYSQTIVQMEEHYKIMF